MNEPEAVDVGQGFGKRDCERALFQFHSGLCNFGHEIGAEAGGVDENDVGFGPVELKDVFAQELW